jgi:hypothetical protein
MQIWEPYDNPFWKNSDGGRKKEREKKEEKKSMIRVVPSCLKDADGARTRSDQKSMIIVVPSCLKDADGTCMRSDLKSMIIVVPSCLKKRRWRKHTLGPIGDHMFTKYFLNKQTLKCSPC